MTGKEIVLRNVRDFDPTMTFTCGQCFRWESFSEKEAAEQKILSAEEKIHEIWTSVVGGERIFLGWTPEDSGGTIRILGQGRTDEKFWQNYLDLGRNYEEVKSRLSSGDEVMKKACEAGDGIRILRQDLWEVIISFLLSQNNNIPRIRKCVENLAEAFGEPVPGGGYALPRPSVLADLREEELRSLGLGYRAKYLIGTAKAVEAHGYPTGEKLQDLPGVGPKVADCIRLFGLGETDRFPIDVWMRRVMHRLYGIPEKDIKEMKRFAGEKFGSLGGFAQQYLFYYIRQTEGKEKKQTIIGKKEKNGNKDRPD